MPPGEVKPLTMKIEEVVGDKKKLEEMFRWNLEKAHKYTIDRLNKRRNDFYLKISELARA